jgi:hypothetical protein
MESWREGQIETDGKFTVLTLIVQKNFCIRKIVVEEFFYLWGYVNLSSKMEEQTRLNL